MRRRALLGAGAGALAGCAPPPEIAGGFVGPTPARGHRLRQPQAAAPVPAAAVPAQRTRVLVAGGGVAGLAAARALRLRGIEDMVLLELEDGAGGNSRPWSVDGIACPLGAHYLPLPGGDAHEVQELLEELGLRRRVAGRWRYDERHLCHSPQERLFFEGSWQDGLLPVQGVGAGTLAAYRRFADRIAQARADSRYALPIARAAPTAQQLALDRLTFAAWLDREGLADPHLRWYLDYCCRDDYGAGTGTVSAWAGIHYFASRHGFDAPGADGAPGDDGGERGVLTWPEGNGWLTRALARPLGERLRSGRLVTRVRCGREAVEVEAWDFGRQAPERWLARHCIVALPLFVAASVLENPPPALRAAAAQLRHAPWLVSNIRIDAPLTDRPGAAPSWDNVIYGAQGLGYVDAMHQSLLPVPGATVLTHYHAPLAGFADPAAARQALLQRPWSAWRDAVLGELAAAHPDLPAKVRRIDIARYGHAMSIPVPGLRGSAALAALQRPLPAPWQRLGFAHGDLSGYSVFEEAFSHGHRAGLAAA